MAKVSKEKSERSAAFAKGGNTRMFGKQHVGTEKPGVTSSTKAGSDGKFAAGGKGKMFGFAGSQSLQPGRTSAR